MPIFPTNKREEATCRAMDAEQTLAEALARAEKAERERDELLVERACVDEAVDAFRAGAASIEASAERAGAAGATDEFLQLLRVPKEICLSAAGAWAKKPKLSQGLATEYVEMRTRCLIAEADALRGQEAIHQLKVSLLCFRDDDGRPPNLIGAMRECPDCALRHYCTNTAELVGPTHEHVVITPSTTKSI